MDQGHVVEFGAPKVLLKNENGYFCRLISELDVDAKEHFFSTMKQMKYYFKVLLEEVITLVVGTYIFDI